MNKIRPVNLDLGTLTFPPMAIVSILHRIAGIVLFLLLPVMIYFWGLSLQSVSSFEHLHHLLLNPYNKLILWAFSSAITYHLLAGIRHLFMDMGFGETLVSARRSAILILVLAVIAVASLGVWIW